MAMMIQLNLILGSTRTYRTSATRFAVINTTRRTTSVVPTTRFKLLLTTASMASSPKTWPCEYSFDNDGSGDEVPEEQCRDCDGDDEGVSEERVSR